jgi:hypothetical protein
VDAYCQVGTPEAFFLPFLPRVPQKPKFKVGQKAYLHKDGTREGPYLIATITSGKCTLCLENGEPAKDDEEIELDYLEAA